MRRRPAGADNFLKWRRSIDEHLELRRMTFHEFGMFAWLCTKASHRTGRLRTSWQTLAHETGLSADHVEQVCRALKRKRYVWYPAHRGTGRRLIEVEIDKFPTTAGGYTDLSSRFRRGATRVPRAGPPDALTASPTGRSAERRRQVPTDVRAEWPTDVLTERPTDVLTDLLTDLRARYVDESRGSPPGRSRRDREREKEREGTKDRDRGIHVVRARRQAGIERIPPRREDLRAPMAIGDLLAAQPRWRPPADGRPTPSRAEARATTNRDRRAATASPAPDETTR